MDRERTLREELLSYAAEDWLDSGWVLHIVRQSGVRDSTVLRDLSCGLLAGLIADGLIVLGDLIAEEHHPWELTPEESILRLIREWRSEPDTSENQLGGLFWVDVTESGEAMAKSVWRREDEAR